MRVDRLIEPMTSFNVARLQRDVGASSNVGGLITAVVREGGNDAFTGGIDHNIRWDRSRWHWNGSYAITRAPGEGVGCAPALAAAVVSASPRSTSR